METTNESKEIQPKPLPIEKMHKIKIRCRFCGQRFGMRKANIYTMEDKAIYCEACNRKL